MIPLAVPRDNFILNLLSVSTVTIHPAGTIGNKEDQVDVKLIDGRLLQFTGQEAEVITAEIRFALGAYHAYQQHHIAQQSQIITPANGKIM